MASIIIVTTKKTVPLQHLVPSGWLLLVYEHPSVVLMHHNSASRRLWAIASSRPFNSWQYRSK